ncbi:MAG TPA: hypothetical protein VKA34_16120 [Balneolales bacterium]|nr:hypothetical protein [Balneolales bacterium]
MFSSHFERTYELYTRRDSPADVFSPEVLDDYVSPENPVRVVDVYVGDSSMEELGFSHAPRSDRTSALLSGGYLYGYQNWIPSSRPGGI